MATNLNEANINNDLFADLKDLGFDNVDNVTIYDEQKKQEKASVQEEEKSVLFDRKLKCPVCRSNITVRAIRASSIRRLSQDTDLMVRYSGYNPMFYDAWVCVKCGYAGLSSQFNDVSYKQEKDIKKQICSKWKPKKYPPEYDIDTSIERYKLALLNAIVKNAKVSDKALICLKLAWHYRLKEDKQNEKSFLKQALQGFENAYEKESFPIAKMDEPTLSYLIGELYRRLGDNKTALIWFGRVLANRAAKNKIKDMAREQKYLIVDQRKETNENQGIFESQQDNDSNDEQKKGFWTKLFG